MKSNIGPFVGKEREARTVSETLEGKCESENFNGNESYLCSCDFAASKTPHQLVFVELMAPPQGGANPPVLLDPGDLAIF